MEKLAEKVWAEHLEQLLQICQMTGQTYRKAFSQEIDKILNICGYSDDRIKEQVLTYTKFSHATAMWAQKSQRAKSREWSHVIMAGSRREGSSLYNSSDVDNIAILTDHRCYETITHNNLDQEILLIDTKPCPPGYCLLKIHNTNNPVSDKVTDKDLFLSSKLFMDIMVEYTSSVNLSGKHLTMSFHNKQGPSTPFTIQNTRNPEENVNPTDNAYALLCHCPSYLQRWRNRRRANNWPSKEVIDKVASLPVFVVPVGQNETQLQTSQWRFCFNLGEIVLVHSLNNTQMKIYILLKLTAKYLLKPICEHMTSFVMKNIIFWLAELKPMEDFNPDTLLDRFVDALTMLQECIRNKQLNYYMIPKRNLFMAKISDSEQSQLLEILKQMTENHGQDYLKANIVETGNNPDDSVQLLIQSEFVKLYLANLHTRVEAMTIAPFSPAQVSTKMEKLGMFHFMSSTSRAWFTAHATVTNLLPIVWRFGLELITNPWHVKHEKIMDPSIDVGNFDEWICPTCQRLALSDTEGACESLQDSYNTNNNPRANTNGDSVAPTNDLQKN